jgi:predicted MPP superfamily phosphohydrolase
LVNNTADEMEPWMNAFRVIAEKTPDGVYSILGNHDYGDYWQWPSEEAKRANLARLKATHAALGWRLLLNEALVLKRGTGQLDLVGVENWGLPPFPQYGNLERALEGLDPQQPKILLSHDPSHFDAVVKKHPANIGLTLSGHTHGMQFGIEIPGWIQWSPVKWKYPKWAGLYRDNASGKTLYVNRGFGYLAFPGRVGIWPEITVLELTAKPLS